MNKLLLLLIVIVVGCGQQAAKEQEPKDKPTAGDSTPIVIEKERSFEPLINTTDQPIEDISDGIRVFVDRVHVFQETNEPYVWVGLKDGYDWRTMDSLKKHCDSVLYTEADEEIRRSRFPMGKAEEYLDLELLDGITLFNYNHQKIGKTALKRIEFFEDVLGEQFVAILETDSELIGDRFYGINGTNNFISGLFSEAVSDQPLEEKIKEIVNVKTQYEWDFESIEIQPYGLIYSFYSVLTNRGEKSYLFESSENQIKLMTEISNDYSIFDLTPVSIQKNGKPVLLLWVGPPETDIEWFTPAVYNGSTFEITNNRIMNFGIDDGIKTPSILDQTADLRLGEFKGFSDSPSSDQDTLKCLDWELSNDQIEEIIKKSKPINGPEWHHLFSHYPCSFRGTIYQDDQEFEVDINSGSWLTITSDTTIYYGDHDGTFLEWFHDGVWDE